MKKYSLLTVLLLTFFISFAQSKLKTDSTHKVVVVTFPDSASYFQFLDYIGSIPTKSEYSNIYFFFKTLPARFELVVDKPKQLK